jgi:hypothetical protein
MWGKEGRVLQQPLAAVFRTYAHFNNEPELPSADRPSATKTCSCKTGA